MACLTAATGRRLGASARLGVAIVASATRLDSTLSQELPHALARSLYNKLYNKIALYIALQRRRLVKGCAGGEGCVLLWDDLSRARERMREDDEDDEVEMALNTTSFARKTRAGQGDSLAIPLQPEAA
ncbi:hypothetical protein EMIHUDRAFT_252085 [Emiliania huxleyi CCMP1516]|uniref:Uncharacterized protein n=2 Tax=Emiliania huxleyi TaxID=2903 RepID=A0A0D3KNW9_EMIH1|nr:hypothetical protein EMIHUDRAFT_252085 [Emiliania huxleyi CCMP1516]EOD37454.1 hypothetical protein EMIHUDRAFT_252085 [Emiliania huxleyi CCMP1516]|eukprot:XP_005789883.1 hypothetical protein EMIHUDRAFT_252085 [Emiliania huxleyi CCMP1516]